MDTTWSGYAVETGLHTGEFVEVFALDVQDHGGNVLWSGEAGDEPRFQVATRLVATKTGQAVAGGDVLCAYAK